LDRQLGHRHRHSPRWLEVTQDNPLLGQKQHRGLSPTRLGALTMRSVYSAATFWQNNNYGPFGNQDNFLGGDITALRKYVFLFLFFFCLGVRIRCGCVCDKLTMI
jgi:hypothetical protein